MSITTHNVLVVTSWHISSVREAHAKALELQANVSSLVPYMVNTGGSFMVAPNGSKDGWPEDEQGAEARQGLIAWMEKTDAPLEWAMVSFSTEDGITASVGAGKSGEEED